MSSAKETTVPREELYQRVWTSPLRTLAKEFGVSDVGLAKICEKHQIPRPEQGHWVRVRLGQNPEQTPLPAIGDARLALVRIAVRSQVTAILAQDIEPKVQVQLAPVAIAVDSERPLSHPLAIRTKRLLAHPQKDERGLLFPKEGKPVAHIRVSQGALPRSLSILDALFRALDHRGIAITWGSADGANLSATVLGESVSFWIAERIRRVDHVLTAEEARKKKQSLYTWFPKWDYKATGELSLAIGGIPYNSKIRHTWSDGVKQRLENCLGAFVAGLHFAALALKRHREECGRRERHWEEQRRRREAERRREEEFQRKAKIVSAAADAWHTSKRIDDFAMAMRKISETANLSENERRDVGRFARWAKGYAGRMDPIQRFEGLVAEFKDLEEADSGVPDD